MSAPAADAGLAVVIPVYRNQETLRDLHARLRRALADPSARIVFVVDGSPDQSATVVSELAGADGAVELLELERNVGQHRAVLAGLGHVRGVERVVILDADLQDPPEAIPPLLAALRDETQVVFAGRRGKYQGAGRRLTSRTFKRLLAASCGVPRDAGMFMALDRGAVERLLALEGPPPFVVAMIGRAGLRAASVPVERSPRTRGRSAYGGAARLRSAIRGLRWGLWGRLGTRAETEPARQAHNRVQRS